MIIRHIRFVKLHECRILAVVVSVSGAVQNILFDSETSLSQDQLNRFSNYLNALLGNLTLSGVKRKVLKEMANDKRGYDELFAQVLALSKSFFAKDPDQQSDVMLDGKLNLLEHPEFADVERMKGIFKAFEEKGSILKILDGALGGEQLRVIIGSESCCEEMRHCSLVTAEYGREDRTLGRIGVIGPTRMDYSRIIPLVNYIADAMSRRLQN
jgi:heat-inducible transcriptional repressor